MTICVAALCIDEGIDEGKEMVVMACDRMVSLGDERSAELEMSKAWQLTNSVFVLTAGDTSLQAEVLRPVAEEVQSRVEKEPDNWWRVDQIARLYERQYQRSKQRRLENAVLSPWGLTYESFFAKQNEMSRDFVSTIAHQVSSFQIPGVEAIFAGVDQSGARLFDWIGESISDRTLAGYSAIGVGYRHVDAEMITRKHTRLRPLVDTLSLVHSAKRRAEAASGVGIQTDVFFVGPALGRSLYINAVLEGKVLKELDKQFERRVRGEERAAAKSVQHLREFLEAVPQTQGEQASKAPPIPPDPSNEPEPHN